MHSWCSLILTRDARRLWCLDLYERRVYLLWIESRMDRNWRRFEKWQVNISFKIGIKRRRRSNLFQFSTSLSYSIVLCPCSIQFLYLSKEMLTQQAFPCRILKIWSPKWPAIRNEDLSFNRVCYSVKNSLLFILFIKWRIIGWQCLTQCKSRRL